MLQKNIKRPPFNMGSLVLGNRQKALHFEKAYQRDVETEKKRNALKGGISRAPQQLVRNTRKRERYVGG